MNIQPKFVNMIVSSLILLVGCEVNDEFTFAKNHQILPSIWSMSLVNKLQGENKRDIHKPRGHFLDIFDPLPPSWSLLLNKAYDIKWSFS